MSNFKPVDRQTDYLFLPSVEDWLPENSWLRKSAGTSNTSLATR